MELNDYSNRIIKSFASSPFVTFDSTPAKCLLFTQQKKSVTIERGSAKSLLEYLATTDANPVSAKLDALGRDGKVPTWLRLNRKLLSGIAYTTGSEISFDLDASNLPVGKYIAEVTAAHSGYKNAVLELTLIVR